MAKNLKTVRHRFNYRQCDTFAAYLNHMARQGWHFKEFRSTLVFEKGEPEDAVYAVEIFTDGTAHDMQPSYKAMNFAEYCEVDAQGGHIIGVVIPEGSMTGLDLTKSGTRISSVLATQSTVN